MSQPHRQITTSIGRQRAERAALHRLRIMHLSSLTQIKIQRGYCFAATQKNEVERKTRLFSPPLSIAPVEGVDAGAVSPGRENDRVSQWRGLDPRTRPRVGSAQRVHADLELVEQPSAPQPLAAGSIQCHPPYARPWHSATDESLRRRLSTGRDGDHYTKDKVRRGRGFQHCVSRAFSAGPCCRHHQSPGVAVSG